MNPRNLSDAELIEKLKKMAQDERLSLKDFIRHLKVFDERRLAARTEHATTYMYCRNELRLGEGEAYRRLQVAGVIDRVPELLDYIESGALSLTVACALSPFLTKANIVDLAESCRGKSRREAEAIIASYKSTPAARDIVRWMGKKTVQPEATRPDELFAAPPPPNNNAAAVPAQSAAAPGEPSLAPAPPAAEARIHFNVPGSVLAKLERAKGLLRHKFPKGDFADVLNEALEALLDRIDLSRRPDPSRRPVLPGRRRIPDWVKKAVWDRDGGRCAFSSVDGKRCDAAEWLEYDHITPFALGGVSDDPDNVRLLCRAHNQHRAREDFGDAAWTGGTFEGEGAA